VLTTRPVTTPVSPPEDPGAPADPQAASENNIARTAARVAVLGDDRIDTMSL
jgi:hypothetical protein